MVTGLFCSGETHENRLHVMQGQLDTKLNETGIRQADSLARVLSAQHFDKVYSSDLSRAYDTCVSLVKDPTVIIADTLLRERKFGLLEGKPVQALFDVARETNTAIVDYVPEGGETLLDVRNRVIRFLGQTLLPDARDGQSVLVVSHGGVLREIITYLSSFGDHSFDRATCGRIPPNTSVSEVSVTFRPVEGCVHSTHCLRLHWLDHLEPSMRERALNQKQVNNLVTHLT